MITAQTASLENLDQLVPLFHKYRLFYKQHSDISSENTFLKNRIIGNKSVIFLASIDGKAVGFMQLFFTFSSVSLQPSLILNDLYVSETIRKKGIVTRLLEKAKLCSITNDYKGLALETAVDNPAQKPISKIRAEKEF